jgi:hypothetical protein
MGKVDPAKEAFEKTVKEQNKKMRQVKRSGAPMVCVSWTVFGMVGPGMPIPAGVPPNFALKQNALLEFQQGRASSNPEKRGNMKGEKFYREYYDDIEDNTADWLKFFDVPDHYEHAEHTCGILGTLATIYRQRGALEDCEKVLDMEGRVMARYQRSTVVNRASTATLTCCDELNFKYQIIRYNLYCQMERYDQCVMLYRELMSHELKYNLTFDQQMYLFMVAVILKKKPTATVVDSLTDAEVMRMVKAPMELEACTSLADRQKRKTALHSCAANNCKRVEDAMAQFKPCPRCKTAFYCGKACQKDDWKKHKKICASLSSSSS